MNTVLTQALKEFVSESWYFPQIRVVDAVEILIITFLFYQIILWIKNTKAWMLLRGILVVALFILVAAFFKMYTILWIAQNSLPVMDDQSITHLTHSDCCTMSGPQLLTDSHIV